MKHPSVSFFPLIPLADGLDSKDGGRPLYRLRVPLVFCVNGKAYDVPAGFVFDYASVPRGLWNVLPPYDPSYAGAALIHDWLYRIKGFDRRFCDHIFLAAMEFRGVPRWKREAMYAAVKWFGAGAYRKNTLEDVIEDRALGGYLSLQVPLWDVNGKYIFAEGIPA